VIVLLLFLFVFLTVLAPSIKLAEGVPLLRPEMVVVAVAFGMGHARFITKGDVPKLLAAFAVVAAVAIGMSYRIFRVPFNASDLSIFPMLLQYWLVYCFVAACVRKGLRWELLWAAALAIAVSALVAVFQKLNLLGVNDWLTRFYIDEEGAMAMHIQLLASGNPNARAVGTVGDPRHCAMMLGFGVAAAMALLLGNGGGRGKWLLISMLGVMGLGLLVTYSRTGLLAAAAALCCGLWLVVRRGGNVVVPVSLGIVAIVTVAVASSKLGVVEEDSRLSMSAGEMVNSSGYARVRDTLEPFQKSVENPLLLITGMGPSKAVLPGSEHGEIGWLVLRYGLTGLFIYLAMVKRAWFRGLVIVEKGRFADAMVASFVLQGIMVWMVFFLAESIFKLGQIMSMNMLLLGSVAGLRIQSAGRAASRRRKAPRKEVRSTVSHGNKDAQVTDPDLQL
jgi:hypothetical protein